MLHIILAQGWRLGADTHGSTFTPASGQVLVAFQLLANSNTLFTTNPPWVVKSFFPSPLKSPHRPQTFPCQQGSATLMMPTSTAVPSPQSLNCREVSVTPGTHAMLRLQEDSDGCFTIPHHCQADRGINHQVHADCPYFVVNQRAVSKVLFLIFTLQQFHFRSLISKKFSWFFFFLPCTENRDVQIGARHIFCTHSQLDPDSLRARCACGPTRYVLCYNSKGVLHSAIVTFVLKREIEKHLYFKKRIINVYHNIQD